MLCQEEFESKPCKCGSKGKFVSISRIQISWKPWIFVWFRLAKWQVCPKFWQFWTKLRQSWTIWSTSQKCILWVQPIRANQVLSIRCFKLTSCKDWSVRWQIVRRKRWMWRQCWPSLPCQELPKNSSQLNNLGLACEWLTPQAFPICNKPRPWWVLSEIWSNFYRPKKWRPFQWMFVAELPHGSELWPD